FDNLRDHATVGQGLQGLGQGGRRDAVERNPLVVGRYLKLRDEDLLLYPQIDDTGDRRQPGAQRLGQRSQRIQILAEDLEDDLRLNARKAVIEGMGGRLPDGHRYRPHGEPGADVLIDFLLGSRRARQIDVELRVVNAFSVLVELGAPRAAAHALDL